MGVVYGDIGTSPLCTVKEVLNPANGVQLALGVVLFFVMATWRRGCERLAEHIGGDDPPLVPFLQSLAGETIPRARRIAVYPTAHPKTLPHALMHNLKHYQVLHERNVLASVRFLEVP